MTTTVKVQDLVNLGTIQLNDKLVGERTTGQTRQITFDNINDSNGNPILKFTAVASAVNYVNITNNISSSNPFISAAGSDTNISLWLKAKGSASVIIENNGTADPLIINSGTGGQHQTTFSIANTAATRTVTLQDASGTMAFTALSGGGTNNTALTASNGGIVYSDASKLNILAGTATAQQLLMSQSNTAPIWSTATYPTTATSAGTVLRSNGTNWAQSSFTIPDTFTANTLVYCSSSNTLAALTSANNGLLVTGNTGVPSITAGPGAGNRFLVSRTSNSPTWSSSTIPSTAGSAGTIVRSDGTNYTTSTATFADTYTASNILYSNGSNTVTGLATANNGVLVTNGSGVPSISSTLPSGIAATNMSLTTPSIGVATGTSFNSITGLAAQSDQETATSTVLAVSPGRQQYHPSAAKFWVYYNTVPTIQASYNVTSVTNIGTGNNQVNFTVNFSSTAYSVVSTPYSPSSANTAFGQAIAASSFQIQTVNGVGSAAAVSVMAVGYGDQ